MRVREPLSVSVVITTQDRPHELRQAVRSVVKQSCVPDEIVVVDDASDPPVAEPLVRGWTGPVPCVLVRNGTPLGPGGARNAGVRASRGTVVMFLDDDDTWETDKIDRQLKVFESRPEVGLVYSGRLVVDGRDRDQVLYRIPAACEGEIFPSILYHNCIGVTSSVALRRTVFDSVGGFDEAIPARVDYDMWIRCGKVTLVRPDGGFGLRYTAVSYTGNQVSRKPVEVQEAAVRHILDKYKSDIENLGCVGRRRVWAEHYFYVAKSARRVGLLSAGKWLARAMWAYPRIRYLLLLLPDALQLELRNRMSSRVSSRGIRK